MTQTYAATDDILAGVLALKTEGDSATRSLSRTALFRVLSYADSITVAEVHRLIGVRYSERAAQRYAEAARVASKALAVYFPSIGEKLDSQRHPSRLADMQALDAPYAAEVATAEAQCLALPPTRGADTLQLGPAEQRTPAAILRRSGYRDAT